MAAVDGVAPEDLCAGTCPSCHRTCDAGRSLLGNDHGPLVVADIATRRRDVSERSAAPGQTAYLAGLLAALSGAEAHSHAAALLSRFGSIAAVVTARSRELAEVFGTQSPLPTYISAVRRLLQAGMREHITRSILDPADPSFTAFVIAHFIGLQHEELLAFFADSAGRFLHQQTLVVGTSRLEFQPSVLFRPAISLGAAQIVLAHNHPSGTAFPSEEDVAATRRIGRDGNLLGIELRDHLIVGGNAVFSMMRANLL